MADDIKEELEKIRKAKTEKPPPDRSEEKREQTVSMPEQPTEDRTSR